MKHYDFNEVIPRKGTHCVKHDTLLQHFGSEDLLPMWVADNDYRSPDFVMEALRERCQHEVLGYAIPHKGWYEAVLHWLSTHYHVQASKHDLHFIPGIVAGISFALQALTQPGDGVLVFTPVYPPFINLPQGSGRRLVCSPLLEVEGRFAIDFDDLEQKAAHCRMLILSNPHNPAGTIWSADELRRLASIASKHHLVVLSDEIHADLVLPHAPLRHTSFTTVSPEAEACGITFIAPSKTFNIAGLGSSVAYVANPELRKHFFSYLNTYEVANGNIFAFVGAEAAYKHGEEWLRQLLEHLQSNVDYLNHYTKTNMPRLKLFLPEASYLAWLDFSDYGISHEEVKRLLLEEAHLALNDGRTFSPTLSDPSTHCRFRLNIGCPRPLLSSALSRLQSTFSHLAPK